MNIESIEELKSGNDIHITREDLVRLFSEYIHNQKSLCQDNVNIMEILPPILKLQNDKGLVYGRSYMKYGEVSIFMNVSRKFDRIENIMSKAMKDGTSSLHSDKSSTPTETFLDTIIDMAVYCLMWAGYVKDNHPEEFQKFLVSNNLTSSFEPLDKSQE